MEKVKVNKTDLIKILKQNRDVHVKEFEEATCGYRMAVEMALKKKLKDVKAGKEFDLYFSDLSKPASYVKDYENVIGMLEITTEEAVSITMEEYLKYYKNEWAWSRSWSISNAPYATLYSVAGVGKVK